MHCKKNISFVLILFFTFLLQAEMLAQATFEGLGHLPPGMDVWSSAFGVSADGLVVVGWSDDDVITKAFRWTELGGMEDLGGLPGTFDDTEARSTSTDGSVVVGFSKSGHPNIPEAFRWTSGDMVGLGFLPGINSRSYASDVSSDGLVVVGRGQSGNPQVTEAFRWTQSGGMIGLGFLSSIILQSEAYGVSSDGSVVVGRSRTDNNLDEAFIWTESGGMVGLGDLPGGVGISRAYDVTPDGLIVVGSATGPNGLELFRWTSAGGMEGLGNRGGTIGPGPYAVSADGSVIVGTLDANDSVFIYTDADGIRNLKEVLESDFGLDLSDWTLDYAREISDDGKVIVGVGRHPNGIREAWRVILIGSQVSNGTIRTVATSATQRTGWVARCQMKTNSQSSIQQVA
ncbi:MAG: PEP-CTERM sorting domain-containing protein [Bacteroidetes bacterium]|nr:PEP-CTERM sorting domain-containing protein [Bacteroidota bacterium]